MALKKTITLDNGLSAEYFKVTSIRTDFDGDTVVTALLYKDKVARDDGKSPVEEHFFRIPKLDSRKEVYAALKKLSFEKNPSRASVTVDFKQSEDV